MIRVLADHHHHALWESLRLLFEERFGWELYRPIGMEWFEEELWNYERFHWGDAVAHQYLDHWDTDTDCGDHWERIERKTGKVSRMVTLEQFRSQRWDFIVATLDHNERAYAKLARESGARFGIEIGNQWGEHAWEEKPFVLSSIKPDPWPSNIEGVTLRQEFDLDLFRFVPPDPFHSIASFMQVYPQGPNYGEFTESATLAPEFEWGVYGAYGEAPLDQYARGDLERQEDIAAAMRATSLGWHIKHWSDGYGHVLHNFMALGRPVLAWTSYYDGRWDGQRRIAADLFVEGVTSFDITSWSASRIVELIRDIAKDEDRYQRMCEATAAHFRRTVDFDAEADAAHKMLTGVPV
jgi:hypothetical protein